MSVILSSMLVTVSARVLFASPTSIFENRSSRLSYSVFITFASASIPRSEKRTVTVSQRATRSKTAIFEYSGLSHICIKESVIFTFGTPSL